MDTGDRAERGNEMPEIAVQQQSETYYPETVTLQREKVANDNRESRSRMELR
jgi:hypothetical protein